VHGLRILQRMREQYGASASAKVGEVVPSPTAATGIDKDGEEDGPQPLIACGFLTGVEDVVQPYSLPRPIHAVFSSPPRSPNPDGRAPPAAPTAPPSPFGTTAPDTLLGSSSSASVDDEDEDNAAEGGAHVPPLPPFPVEDEEDSETETAGTGTGTAGGTQSQPQHPRRLMPKSMAELAAEAAQAQAAGDVAAPQMGLREAPSASASVTAATATVAASLRITRAGSKAKGESKSKPKPKPRMKTVRGKGGKRARAQDDDQDSNEYDGWESRSGTELRVAAKRARNGLDVGVGVEAEAVPVPPSDRVLRTRKVTSPEQLARERK